MAVVEDNIAELEDSILAAIGFYEDTIPKQMSRLVSDITRELKNGNYKNRTGDLRRSIQVKLIDNDISINMLNYGYFISFGVQGGKYKALGLPDEVASAFGTRKFTSKKRKAWGIKPRDFYPDDIEERIMEILTNE